MANEQPSNFTSNGVVLAVLAVTGAVFFYRDAPLQGLRPELTEPQFHHAASVQDVEARLWQDPFAAVARVVDDKDKDSKCSSHHNAPPFESAVGVIGVMMESAPYTEASERRRRTRYAVLSGLAQELFVPETSDHIGFWCFRDTKGAPYTIPFEQFRSVDKSSEGKSILVLWLNEDAISRHPLTEVAALAESLHPARFNILGPFSSDTLVEMAKEARNARLSPFALCGGERPTSGNRFILQKGIDGLPRAPPCDAAKLCNLWQIRSYAAGVESKRARSKFWKPPEWTPLAVQSPWGRTAQPLLICSTASDSGRLIQDSNRDWPELARTHFFSYGSTADDNCANSRISKAGIAFLRTIATDKELATSIVQELKLRHVQPGVLHDSYTDHVALISEWDTTYGRKFADTMVRAFAEELKKEIPGSNAEQKEQPECSIAKCVKDNSQYNWVHKRKYLRGLDGSIASDDKKKDGKDSSGESEKTADKERAKAKADEKAFDRPHGQGQQDYLRRIAKDLRGKNDELLKKNGRIAAIGVVGSDVFDKLLVLRALKPEFPEALFFTTDFDYALLMPSELAWTRNLIIASSFGPKLRDEIQGEIPPFRDNYETSAFLAARLAIQDFGSKPVAQSTIDGWLTPQIFEIERGGGILAFPRLEPDGKDNLQATRACPKSALLMSASTSIIGSGRSTGGAPDSSTQPDNENENCAGKHLAHCGRIHPEVEFPYGKPKGLSWIAGALAAITVLLAFARIVSPSSTEESPTDTSGFSEKWIEFIAFITLILLFVAAAILICRPGYNKLLLSTFIISILATIASLEYFINERSQILYNINNNLSLYERKTPSVEIVIFGFILVMAILICLKWDQIGISIRDDGKGVPLMLLQGASLWPSILLRIFMGILSACLLVRGWRKLRTNIKKIQKDMNLEEPGRIIADRKIEEHYTIRLLVFNFSATRKIETGQSKISIIAENRYVIKFISYIYYFICAFLTRSRFNQQDLNDQDYNVKLAWEDLVFQGRLFARVCRVAVYAIIMGFVFFSLMKVFGEPNIPSRGYLAVDVYSVVTIVNVMLTLALLFFVADAIHSFWLFVRELGPIQTKWPPNTRLKYAKDLRMTAHDPILDYWIDLDFIAKRTKCLGDIIYYPFAILALMIISRSAAFANFAPSPPIIITQALSLLILLGCAFALRRAAEKARDEARSKISTNIIRAKGMPKGAHRAAQLEALLARVKGLNEGAFSPITQQPPVRALLLPLGGLGWTTLLDFGLIPGL